MWDPRAMPRLRSALLLAGLGQLLLFVTVLLPLLQPGLEGLWQLWLVAVYVLLDLTAAILLRKCAGLPEEFTFLLPLVMTQLAAFLWWQLGWESFYLAPVLYCLGKAGYLTWLNRGTGRILWKLGRSYEAVGGMALWVLYVLGALLAALRQLDFLPPLPDRMVQTAELLIYAAAAAFLLLSIGWIKAGPLYEEEEDQKSA